MVLRNQGSHEAVIRLYQETLIGYEKLHGPQNFQSLKTTVHLANNAYRNQSRYDETLTLHLRALEANKERFGSDHLNALENMEDLAISLRNLGKYSEAKEFFTEALNGVQKILGETHPTTLHTVMNLTINHQKMGNYTEAEAFYMFILESRVKHLGWGHHYTWRTVECLSDLQWVQGRRDEAEKQAQQCMRGSRVVSSSAIGKRVPTERSPERNSTRPDLQHTNIEPSLGSSLIFSELEPLFLRALRRDQTNLRGYHADKLDTMTSIADVCAGQERYKEAQTMFLDVLEVSKNRYRPDHRDCARIMLALSKVNDHLGYSDGYGSGTGEDLTDLDELKI